MTSPLSSLRKTKRSPIQRNIPFRPVYDIDSLINADLEKYSTLTSERSRANSVNSNIPDDCAELVNDVTDTIVGKRKSQQNMKQNPQNPDSHLTDMDLMSSMMGRISQLQLRNQFHEKELLEKNSQIKLLERKLKSFENAHKPDSDTKIKQLKKDNERLRTQVYEMEEFLADYGMMWLGEDSSDSDSEILTPLKMSSPTSVWMPEESVSNDTGEICVNYDAIIQNIRDLNILAGEGESKIEKTVDGAKLKLPDPVSLSLYANGILMFNGPFRPFTDSMTQVCVKDLTDGYFPTELQKRYPDGVVFSVHDNRNKHYEDKTQKAFVGEGQVLGGSIKPSRLVPSNLDKKTSFLDDDKTKTKSSHVRDISKDQFLSKLPSNVIKSGKIIDIRQAVSDMIQGDTQLPGHITMIETGVTETLRKSAKGKRITALEVDYSTLRIKHLDKTFLLVLNNLDTVGDIRKHLRENMKSLAPSNFDLVSSYPRRVFSDDSETLLNAGLTPNALLHLQVKKGK